MNTSYLPSTDLLTMEFNDKVAESRSADSVYKFLDELKDVANKHGFNVNSWYRWSDYRDRLSWNITTTPEYVRKAQE